MILVSSDQTISFQYFTGLLKGSAANLNQASACLFFAVESAEEKAKRYTNCRPVSLLPQFSKILEKIFHDKLVKFIDKYNILN